MNADFAYAYWVDDTINGEHIEGLDVGFYDLVSHRTRDAVINPVAARRMAEQILSVVDAIEE